MTDETRGLEEAIPDAQQSVHCGGDRPDGTRCRALASWVVRAPELRRWCDQFYPMAHRYACDEHGRMIVREHGAWRETQGRERSERWHAIWASSGGGR